MLYFDLSTFGDIFFIRGLYFSKSEFFNILLFNFYLARQLKMEVNFVFLTFLTKFGNMFR